MADLDGECAGGYSVFVISFRIKENIMKKKVDILDANARALIAFALMVIALLLVYMAFYK